MFFKVVSGPNTGKTFAIKTNASGIAVFTYTSTKTGTDKVGAKLDAVWKCCVDVVWTSPKPPLRYTGYAENASGNFKLPLLGNPIIGPINPRGPVDTTGTTDNTNTIVDVDGPVFDAKVLSAGVKTGSGESTSFASAAGASLLPGVGLSGLANVNVRADSKATCGGLTGTTTITSLTYGGLVLVGPGGTVSGGPFVPPANFTIDVFVGKLVLNEQIKTANKITVNAVHLIVPQIVPDPIGISADIVVSKAESDIHNC